jgi:type IV secretion system protein VirD4
VTASAHGAAVALVVVMAFVLAASGRRGARGPGAPAAGPVGGSISVGTGRVVQRRHGGHLATGRSPSGSRSAARRSRRDARRTGSGVAHWARRAEMAPLLVPALEPGRLVLGVFAGGGRGRRAPLVAAEPAQSVAVVGPTQSGKTSAVAVPAILGWDGPVVAASVKTDLLRDTIDWRRRCGTVWCFDPARTTGVPDSRWSPLSAARTWAGARRVAADLTEVTRSDGTTADGEFWYATAAKLLAPLFFAAASSGRTMHDVVRWVDTQEIDEVSSLLERAGVVEALQAARATWLRDERQRSAVYTTAETVLEPFAEPRTDDGDGDVPAGGFRSPATAWTGTQSSDLPSGEPHVESAPVGSAPAGGDIDPSGLLLGRHTLYLCAPAHDQRRLRALFVAVVKQVLDAAFTRSTRLGHPLDPPLLVVLDEAANIAPLPELDGLAATCAGHGVQLVTVWQDLAQLRARYGERAATVVNNHRARLFLPGVADPGTLDFASQLVGDEHLDVPSVTLGASGERTVTTSPVMRRLLAPDALRRLAPGTGVLVYGSLPAAHLALRPWFADPALAVRAPERQSARCAPAGVARIRGASPGRGRPGQLQSRT